MSVFGDNLNDARLKRQLTLKQLSELSRVSIAMLSKIEAGEKIPTIRVAEQIAASLSLSISDLAGDNKYSKKCIVIKESERKTLLGSETGIKSQLLSPGVPFSQLDFVYSIIPPQSASVLMSPHAFGSEEYFWIIEGQLTIILNKTDTYQLNSGDSIFFKADVYHELKNLTNQDCKYCSILHS